MENEQYSKPPASRCRYTGNTLKLNHDTSTSESLRKDMMDLFADMIVGKHFENKS